MLSCGKKVCTFKDDFPFSPPMTKHTPFVHVNEAARLANVSRRTIDRDIQRGKISGTQVRQQGGRRKIAVVELERVYGQLETRPKTDLRQRPTMSESAQATESSLIQFLREELERERERTRKAESACERWESRFLEAQEKLNGLLLPPPKKPGIMARIFGKQGT